MTATADAAKSTVHHDIAELFTRVHAKRSVGTVWQRRYRARLLAGDAFVVASSAILAGVVWLETPGQVVSGASFPLTYQSLAALVSIGWLVVLWLTGSYDRRVFGVGPDEYKRVAQASLYSAGALAILAYFTQTNVARGWLAIAFPLGLVGLVFGRWLQRKTLHRARVRGESLHRTLVVGDADHVGPMLVSLEREIYAGYQAVGLCTPGATAVPGADTAVVGDLATVRDAVASLNVDTVAVAGSLALSPTLLRQLSWDLEGCGVDLVVSPSLVDVAGPRVHIRPLAGLPMLFVDTPQYSGLQRLGKGLLDFVGASLALVLSMPVLVVAALAIRLEDGGPLLYRQTRVGRGGRRFTILKLRSMTPGSDRALGDLLAKQGRDETPLFKVTDDPRVTRVGAFIRRWSIDELPQLFNVLSGSMSLVGPRPQVEQEVDMYGPGDRRRLLVKPGVTGLWQVSGRSDLSWSDAVRLDLWYVENWSLAQDLLILAKTASAVVRRRGAA